MTRKVDVTGRSTGAYRPRGRATKWQMETPFIYLPSALTDSPSWWGLNPPAFHFVFFLINEHMRHGGTANGQLLAPYAQLEAVGISSRDIRSAIDMAVAFGIVRQTHAGERLGGRTGASRFALAWLPTSDGAPPTNGFKAITQADVRLYVQERKHDRQVKAASKAARATAAAAGTQPRFI